VNYLLRLTDFDDDTWTVKWA